MQINLSKKNGGASALVDGNFVQETWEYFSSELNEKAELVKKRWAYLRDYYRNKLERQIPGRQKIKWPLFDAMSFLETFTECSQTHINFAKPGLSGFEPESMPNPSLEDTEEQLKQIGRDTSPDQ
ncbi:hypothetical protein PoB_000838800 [Plakobranchus ocellatus]|uniref:MADF domain-containing protein n=1 Tax=Plakobranchus ocellatus TaxID=259542 RepID=A0AAV3YHJ8_9GAST|nr:hypothetical protein PoB_000838800 [Plakobranchus ocellatus]